MQVETRFDWPSLDASAPLLEIARISGSFKLRLNDGLITRKVPDSPWLVARERHSRYLLSQGELKPIDNRLLFTFYSGNFQTSIELDGLALRASGQNDYSSADKRAIFALFNAAGAATLAAMLLGIFSQRSRDFEYLYFATGILAWACVQRYLCSGRVFLESTADAVHVAQRAGGFCLGHEPFCKTLLRRAQSIQRTVSSLPHGFEHLAVAIGNLLAAGLSDLWLADDPASRGPRPDWVGPEYGFLTRLLARPRTGQ